MKSKTLICLIILIMTTQFGACNSSSQVAPLIPSNVYLFTRNDFIDRYNNYFESNFTVDRELDYNGYVLETHFYEKPYYYLELMVKDSYISLITVSFYNEPNEDVMHLLYSMFDIIDADFDKTAFDDELTNILEDPTHYQSISFDTVRVHFTNLQTSSDDDVHQVLYYPLKTND